MLDIRMASESDWPLIQKHQQKHLVGIPPELNASFPDFLDAFWLVGEHASVGWMDSDGNRQIVLLWNKGRWETIQAKALMELTCDMADNDHMNLWFLTHTKCLPGAVKAFEHWGFKHVPSRYGDGFATYWRQV